MSEGIYRCEKCKSHFIKKNGLRQERQRFLCLTCGASFIENRKTIRKLDVFLGLARLLKAMPNCKYAVALDKTGVNRQTFHRWRKMILKKRKRKK